MRELTSVLDDCDRARASRFVFERDRDRFVAGRGMLRLLLGRYVGVAPERVVFDIAFAGKPFVRNETEGSPVQFNLSHSDRWALLGVTRAGAIGVDIEAHRELPEADQIVRERFAPAEMRQLLSLPASQRTRGLFACWTRKEAYVKALGSGLSVPLDGFEVSLGSGDAAALCNIDGSSRAAREWTLWDCAVGPDMSAAVAVHATGLHLRRLLLA